MKAFLHLSTLLYILGFYLFASCKKNIDSPVNDGIAVSGTTVQAAFTGRITDHTNTPVIGAVVSAGNKTTSTDINGAFSITGAGVSKNAGLIKVNKTGFFTGYRTVFAKDGSTYFIDVQLIPKAAAGNFSAASGGTITVNNGGSIRFSANSVVLTSTGAAYNGTVNVYAFFLNPADPGFNSYMPGDLRGIDSSNQQRLLQSYGMVIAELESPGGEKLQLAAGKTATLSLPIAPSLQTSAPATIPLWHFDETTGLWKQEGSATRQGNTYTGDVTHFSFWNMDVPYPLISYTALFKDQFGNPVRYCKVAFKRPNGDERFGNADSLGRLDALIPANELLQMRTTAFGTCSNVLLQQNAGPYATNHNAGTITVQLPVPDMAIITGMAVNCSNAPVTDGFVRFKTGNTIQHVPIVNGSFTVQYNKCGFIGSVVAELSAYDNTTTMLGPVKNIVFTSGPTDAGQLAACGGTGGSNSYINLAGIFCSWQQPFDTLSAKRIFDASTNTYRTEFELYQRHNSDTALLWKFTVAGPAITGPGNAVVTVVSFTRTASLFGYPRNFYNTDTLPVIFTAYGPPGGFITGSISGYLRDQFSGYQEVLFSRFHIRRRE